jgi:hypothetical protein
MSGYVFAHQEVDGESRGAVVAFDISNWVKTKTPD